MSKSAAPQKAPATPGLSGDIAIVGIACSYPDARDFPAFWQNIIDKHCAVKPVPPERWDPQIFHDPDPAKGKIYIKVGGYLGPGYYFNPLKYGTMPRALEGADPDQFLLLRCVYEAMDDAGYLNRKFDGRRTEVIIGRGNYVAAGLGNLVQRSLTVETVRSVVKALRPDLVEAEVEHLIRELKASVPNFTPETAPGVIPNIATGRCANRLDLMGPNYTIDAACASTLLAMEQGVRSLLVGTCDMAVVGGLHVFSNVPFMLVFSALGALSRSSCVRPFDEGSDGTIAGEGVGIFVIKRLADAERDGDRIYAVVKGVGTASDGKALGVTAPRVEGEELALRRAYDMAGISPDSVALVEGHGTGTAAGDLTEISALQRVFGPRSGALPNVALGSVKSNIGHAMPAAGAASIVKTVMSLYHRVLPPTINCRKPHDLLCDDQSRFYVNSEPRPWIHGDSATPRRAGVNAFGFGGINAHVILEEYLPAKALQQPSYLRNWENEACILAGNTREELLIAVDKLRAYCEAAHGVALRDIAYTLNTSLGKGAFRLAVVASNPADLRTKLGSAAERIRAGTLATFKDTRGIYYTSEPLAAKGQVAFVFPGEGSQYLNMLADLCIHFPEVRAAFDAADAAAKNPEAYPPSLDIFPPPFFSQEEAKAAEQRLFRIDRATEAVLTSAGALYTLLRNLGIKPDMSAGHSAGEWIGMVAAGMIDIDEFVGSMSKLNAMYRKLEADTNIPRAAMLACGADRDKVARLMRELGCKFHLANDNCPHQIVIVVDLGDAERAGKHLLAAGVFVERLPYDRGYHTPVFTYICEPLRKFFGGLNIKAPQAALYGCTTAQRFPTERRAIVDLAADTFARPILFRDMIERMYADGARIFIEVGPGNNVTGFVDDILRGQPHLAVATNVPRRSGISGLNHALSLLAVNAVPIQFEHLYTRRTPTTLTWDAAKDSVIPEDKQPGTIFVPLTYPGLALKTAPKLPAAAPLPQTVTPLPAVELRLSNGHAVIEPTPVMPPPELPPAIETPALPLTAENAEWLPIAGDVSPGATDVVQQHLQVMHEFLATQDDVMCAFLGQAPADAAPADFAWADPAFDSGPGAHLDWPAETGATAHDAAVAMPAAQVSPQPDAAPVALAALTSGAPPQFAATPVTSIANIQALLLGIVADKTGYPPEMLGLDLDLEAELGIDSIKRVEILSTFQKASNADPAAAAANMEHVAKLKTLRQVLEFLQSQVELALEAAPMAQQAAALPFGGMLADYVPGERIVIHRKIELNEDLYIEDHRFGPPTSAVGASLPTLAVVPLTVSVETMAAAAALLRPGKKVVQARDITASKWIAFETEDADVRIEIEAKAVPNSDVVRVAIYDLNQIDPTKPRKPAPLAEGKFVLADEYPTPPEPWPLEIRNPKTPMHVGHDIYTTIRMFHGRSFQGIKQLFTIGDNGLLARLETLPRNQLLKSKPTPFFQIDPCFLDAAGQLVGYWPVEFFDEGFVMFPIRIAEMTIYRPMPDPGVSFDTRLHITEVTNRTIASNIDAIAPDGALWMRIQGWQDWRFYWSRGFYEFWRAPNRGLVAAPFDVSPWAGDADACVLEPFGELATPFWENLLARLVLSRGELDEYYAFSHPGRRKAWLFGRAAVKDAVRKWIKRRHGLDLYPADVIVKHDDSGRPYVEGHWLAQVSSAPQVSLAHKEQMAIGIAAGQPVGIDLEAVEPRDSGFVETAFEPAERTQAQGWSGAERDEWLTRMWCAKEAVGKWLGIGMNRGPRTTAVRSIDAATGRMQVQTGPMVTPHQELAAVTLRHKDFVIALAV